MTNYRKLVVGAEERVSVVGYDAQNNTFDTLEGLKFQWDDEPNGVLKVDYLKTSAAVVPGPVRAVEDEGEFSSVVHLKGKKTGIVNVTVRAALKSL